ncbi:14984_t:CDS:2, partial [Funneliformis caledonium]
MASENVHRPRFIYATCFTQNADTLEQLKTIDKWLITMGKYDENKIQSLILFTVASLIFQILKDIKSSSTFTLKSTVEISDLSIPSLLHLRIAFQLKKINSNSILLEELDKQYCKNLGEIFTNKLWKFQKEFDAS